MNIQLLEAKKVMGRLDAMVDNAIAGKRLETGFDETRMSALETKLQKFLEMNNRIAKGLSDEKARVNMLISDISHQTKTPIANIKMYAELLAGSDISGKNREYVNILLEQTGKLDFLIHSLIKMSRLENGIITFSPQERSVAPMLENAVKAYSLAAHEKNIEIELADSQGLAVFDEKWTAEALEALLDNAVKYTPNGGKIQVKAEEYQMFLRIDVKDSGIGIGEDEYSKVFMRFYRSPDVAEKSGVGIGLYLAREIITKENGYITVSSEYGKGSTFSVYLPKN